MVTIKILSKELSKKAESALSCLASELQFPIKYLSMSALPNTRGYAFGAVDAYPRDGCYKVWLREDLQEDIFEANLLHEVRHIVQIEAAYPCVLNKDTADFHSNSKAFVEEVGSRIGSVVLDTDVNIWLENAGFSHTYFDIINYNNCIKFSNTNYTHLDDALNFANLVLALLSITYNATQAQAKTLFDAYKKYPLALDAVKDLSAYLLENPPTTQVSAFRALGTIIERLNLWPTYYISLNGKKTRTSKEFRVNGSYYEL